MKELKLFFSWQSDNNKTKKIISDAINKAVHNIKVHHGYSIVIEESTSNVPGTSVAADVLCCGRFEIWSKML